MWWRQLLSVSVAEHDGFCLPWRIYWLCLLPFSFCMFYRESGMYNIGAGIVCGLLACTAAIIVKPVWGIVGLLQSCYFVNNYFSWHWLRKSCDINIRKTVACSTGLFWLPIYRFLTNRSSLWLGAINLNPLCFGCSESGGVALTYSLAAKWSWAVLSSVFSEWQK